jgi:hypothetical protein
MTTKRALFTGVVLGAGVASIVLVASAALAGTGIGSVFNLGATNSVNASTVLNGTTNGQQLRIVNVSTGSAATGVGIHTDPSRPPLAVNSQAKVTNLNADMVDGMTADHFVAGPGLAQGSSVVVLASGKEVPLLLIPTIGAVWAECDMLPLYPHAAVILKELPNIGMHVFGNTDESGVLHTPSEETIVADTHTGGSLQISTSTYTATITSAALRVPATGNCYFTAQAVTTHS